MKKICKVRRCFADEIQVLQDQIWNRSNHFEFIEKLILGPNASARNLVKGKNTRQEKNEQWRTSAKDLTAIYICFTGFISSWLVYSSSITVLSALGEISTVNFWLAKISRGCVCSCMTILLNHHASRTDQGAPTGRSRGTHSPDHVPSTTQMGQVRIWEISDYLSKSGSLGNSLTARFQFPGIYSLIGRLLVVSM